MGPTASGKTAFAVDLAQRLGGELVSADSRQVYRHCDIGTNKPTPDELRGVPCHLLDVVDPGEVFTVADYVPRAQAALATIWARNRTPLLQGGTGLYLKALLEGWNLADASPDPTLRARLEDRLEREGPAALDADLRRIDPLAADRRAAQSSPHDPGARDPHRHPDQAPSLAAAVSTTALDRHHTGPRHGASGELDQRIASG